MSWSEVFKINSNMKKPINEQLVDREFYSSAQIITAAMPYTVTKSGIYKVICVAPGESGGGGVGGHAGGVVVGRIKLLKNRQIAITFNTSSSHNTSFGQIFTAFGDSEGTTVGGTIAPGYTGIIYKGGRGSATRGGSVGLFDPKYIRYADNTLIATANNTFGGDGLFGGKQPPSVYTDNNNNLISYAGGAGGYGGGGSSAQSVGSYVSSQGGAGCVYIELIEEV